MLRLQIGPVQDFIAAARSILDLWSGSYLLSRLMAAGLQRLQQDQGVQLIFPSTEQAGIYTWCSGDRRTWVEGAQTPCLSNKLIAYVPTAAAEALAQAVRQAIAGTWRELAEEVWHMLPIPLQRDSVRRARYDAQVAHHLCVDYAHLPIDLSEQDMAELAAGTAADTPLQQALHHLQRGEPDARYAVIYYLLDHCLNATRKVRHFGAWNPGAGRDAGWQAARNLAKDSLTGREEQILRMEQDADHFPQNPIKDLLTPHPQDVLGGITLIKRLWYTKLFAGYEEKLPENAQWDPNDENAPDSDNHYYAVLAMDGDHIGAALTREKNGYRVTPDFHRRFSETLASFAQHQAGAIVGKHGGLLIYAGGDDVLALLPLKSSLSCAAELREEFTATMAPPVVDEPMTVSAGLAIAHSKAPLQDVVRAAREAESRAKNALGRNAYSVCLMKRSGEIVHWGARWDSGAIALINLWWDYLEQGLISTRGAHRYAELLTPYLSHPNGLLSYTECEDYQSRSKELALAEFDSMLDRQWIGAGGVPQKQALRRALATYLASLSEDASKNPADRLVPLCRLIAFYARKPNQAKK